MKQKRQENRHSFDDLAINLNVDEIPISRKAEGRLERVRGALFFVDKFDDGIERDGRLLSFSTREFAL